MDSKFLFVVITSILIGINSCIPGEEMGIVKGRRGLCYCNNCSDPIKVTHISKMPSGTLKDSSIYELNLGEEIVYFEQTDENINEVWEHTMHRKFDTVKVFRADTVAKIWHGPLTESQTSLHTPYEIGDWERIEKKDTTILRFTITDKDFE